MVPRTNMKNANALVTLERNGIMQSFVQPLVDAGDGLSVKLDGSHAPNVFATVTMVGERPARPTSLCSSSTR